MRLNWNAVILGCIAGCIAAAPISAATNPDWDRAPQVNVELGNFDFTPKTLTFRDGQPYRLHLTNKGSGGHNFSSPDFFRAATIVPDDAAKIVKGGIDLKKGASQDVRIIPAKGRYKLKCTHFMHAAFGMKGEILVE